MTDNTTVVYRVTGTHHTHPPVVLYIGGYSNATGIDAVLIAEGYTVTVDRITTTIEDVTNAR